MARSLSAPRPLLAFSFSAGHPLPPPSVPVCTSLSAASLRISALRLAVRLRADLAHTERFQARRWTHVQTLKLPGQGRVQVFDYMFVRNWVWRDFGRLFCIMRFHETIWAAVRCPHPPNRKNSKRPACTIRGCRGRPTIPRARSGWSGPRPVTWRRARESGRAGERDFGPSR